MIIWSITRNLKTLFKYRDLKKKVSVTPKNFSLTSAYSFFNVSEYSYLLQLVTCPPLLAYPRSISYFPRFRKIWINRQQFSINQWLQIRIQKSRERRGSRSILGHDSLRRQIHLSQLKKNRGKKLKEFSTFYPYVSYHSVVLLLQKICK